MPSRLEAELSQQYSVYVGHWRNLSYLEAELEAIRADEAEAVADSDRRLQVSFRVLGSTRMSLLVLGSCHYNCSSDGKTPCFWPAHDWLTSSPSCRDFNLLVYAL